ncbi:MAG: hypothetical protein QM725_02490 [Lacibacter sp.]
MKSKLYPLSFLLILFLLSSCKKWLPENRIVGSWKVTNAEKRRFLTKELILTGYENGVFNFYENGTASFTDTTGSMTGNWSMRKVDGGYYDADGNWQSNSRTDLLIKLFNFNTNRYIEWYFDNIDFRSSGYQLTGFIYGANYNYRYYFRKQ